MKTARHLDDLVAMIPDGATLVISRFFGVGSPHRLIHGLVSAGRKGLTIIANDTDYPGRGIGKLIEARLVKRLVASHIGANPETQRQMLAGKLEVELVPQGTLAERIRAGGYGLGGVLTRTGLGTPSNRENPPSKSTARSGCWKNRPRHFALVSAGKPTTSATSRTSDREFQPGDGDGRRDRHRRGRGDRPRWHYPAGLGPDARDPRGSPTGRTRMTTSAKETIARRVAKEVRARLAREPRHRPADLGGRLHAAGGDRLLPHGERPDRHRRAAAPGHGEPGPHQRRE